MQYTQPQSPFIMIIFGATGDLSQNKLIPALFSLYKQKRLPKDFYIIGFARRDLTHKDFASMFSKLIADKKWKSFSSHMMYQQGVFEEVEGYTKLVKLLKELDDKAGACITRLFYLATPPANYESILFYLGTTKLSEGCGQGSSKWTRLIVEKPFGSDLQTARALDAKLCTIFEEKQ